MIHQQLLDDYVAAWNSGDADQLISFFADDLVYTDIAMGKTFSHQTMSEFLPQFYANNENVYFEVIFASANDDSISWEWRMTGNKKDGTQYDRLGMSITEIIDGKVAKNRDYWSSLPTPDRDV